MVDRKVSGAKGLSSASIQHQKLQSLAKKMIRQEMRQVASQRSLQTLRDSGFDIVLTRNFKTMEELKSRKQERYESKGKHESIEEEIQATQNLDDVASRFNQKNFELESRMLMALLNSIKQTDTVEDILKKVLEFYPDYTLADEALDFLIQTTRGDLGLRVLQAKELLNSRFSREIKAGKNIATQAREFSKVGLGSPTSLRDMYRDITGSPRLPIQLFQELSTKFNFNTMKTVISFLLHSLGADLKAKGPSISRAELHRLVNDTRTLQAILGVYRFFKSRMKLIQSQFKMNNLSLPSRLDFEILSKQFISLLTERYVTLEKIFQLAKALGLSEEIIAQIIILTQMRDAIRQISPKLYKNLKHKDDLLAAFLEALEALEDELEEEEEDEDEDEEI